MSRFGKKLRALRKRRGLTQKQLAEALGYSSHAFVSQVERGWKAPSLDMVLSTADLFGVTTDALLRDNITLEEENDDAHVR